MTGVVELVEIAGQGQNQGERKEGKPSHADRSCHLESLSSTGLDPGGGSAKGFRFQWRNGNALAPGGVGAATIGPMKCPDEIASLERRGRSARWASALMAWSVVGIVLGSFAPSSRASSKPSARSEAQISNRSSVRGGSCSEGCDRKAAECLEGCDAKFKEDKPRVECKLQCATDRQKCDAACVP